MSLNRKKELSITALQLCRQLRTKQTEAEKVLWQELRRKNIAGLKFYRQHPFYHDTTGKESFFIVDFYCHSSGVAVELDGEIHESREIEDEERTQILETLGVRVVRFTNDEVLNDLGRVLKIIQEECKQSQTRRQFPLPSQGRG